MNERWQNYSDKFALFAVGAKVRAAIVGGTS